MGQIVYKFIFILFFLLLIPVVLAAIRDGSCYPGETCLLSMFQENNSHVGECGHYNYSLCYPGIHNTNLSNSNCTDSEHCILSQYQHNNSHIGRCGYYNYSLCISGNWRTDIVETYCNSTPIITSYKHNNSHIGDLEYYNYTLCLKYIPPILPEKIEHPGSSSGMGNDADRVGSTITEQEQTVKGDLYSIDYLWPGLTLLNITDPALSVYRIEMDSSKEAEDVKIKIEESKNTKLSKPDRRVYRYVTIETDLPESFINKVRLIFKIQKNFGEDIKLLRYVGYWEELETNKLFEDDYYEHYESFSRGFSVFAISSEKFQIMETIEKIAQEVTVDKPSKSEIWLYALLPIIMLIIGGLTLLYHLRKLIVTYKKLSIAVLLLSGVVIVLIIPFTSVVLYWAIFPLSLIVLLMFGVVFVMKKFMFKKKSSFIQKLANIFVKENVHVVIYDMVKKPKKKKRKKSKMPTLKELKEVFGKMPKRKYPKGVPSLQELKEVFGKKKKKKKKKKGIFSKEEIEKYGKDEVKKYKL